MIAVKFRKEKLENVKYEGDTQVRWWFDAGTKHLPAVYAIKEGYGWEVYDAEGNCYTRGLCYYSRVRTKAEAKAFIEEYDATEDERIAAEKAEEAARIAEYEAMKARENALMEAFLVPAEAIEVNVGDMITIKLDHASKSGNIGESLDNILVNGRYEDIPCKVVKVMEVSPERYEEFCRNSLGTDSEFDFLMNEGDDGGTVGGTESDHPHFKGMSYAELSRPENMQLYRQTMYGLVHAVVCPGRHNIYIDTQGYQYARYLGTDSNLFLNYENVQKAA